jgi:methionyl-tRNA formyltransferase
MRTVLLTSPAPNQYALSRRLAQEVDLVGLVLSGNEVPKRSPGRELVNRLSGRLVGRALRDAWQTAQNTLASRHGASPPIEPLEVPEINDSATVALLRDRKPELVLVSGTNLVSDEIMRLSSQGAGMINLHTGISPWIKGGPNCTNWCLARGWFHLIGNSVMWLDLGVDSGDLIATERTPLGGDESLTEVHTAVLEHAHGLLIRAAARLRDGAPLPRVPQASVGTGQTFRNAEWNGLEMLRARRNFTRGFQPGSPWQSTPALVPLVPSSLG